MIENLARTGSPEPDSRDAAAAEAAAEMWANLQRDAAPYATVAGHFFPFEVTEAQLATLIGSVAKMRVKDELHAWHGQAIVNVVTAIVEKQVTDFAFEEALA